MKTTCLALLGILAAPLMMANAAIAETPICPDNGTFDAETNSCSHDFDTCPTKDYKKITITIIGGKENEDKTIKKCVTCLNDQKWNWTHQKCEQEKEQS
jgi:hypothetical protein